MANLGSYGYLTLIGAGVASCAGLFSLSGLARRRVTRIASRAAIIAVIAVAAIAFVISAAPIALAARGSKEREADCVIVLGAKVNGVEPSLTLTDRLRASLNYLKERPDAIAILSGGQGPDESMSEAAAMYDWLCERGVDPARLIIEDESTSTKENIAFSLAIINDDASIRSIAVITSGYHIFRAAEIASAAGITDIRLIPAASSRKVAALNYFIRETLIRIYGWISPSN
ncbi:MAG: YdcF family protein [Clostridiales bacterium]|nr:YdcF family protein [Clostridiales bacterium]